MRLTRRAILAVAVLFLWWTVLSVEYARVWTDELTLWTRAVLVAPDKPRPHLQLALALMERQRWWDAQAVLDETARILTTQRLTTWDRRETESALLSQRVLLSRLANGAAPPFVGRGFSPAGP